ncbi:MAG: hypothetical protein GY810_08705 [Aureispira sp.]|nr:hypothetical protein [Aureispira sp.]
MNREVSQLYYSLDPVKKEVVEEVFKDAPKVLRLVRFLGQQAGKDFKTPKAVRFIYREEQKEVESATLINRYYKLRQTLKEWLLGQLKNNIICFTDEERELAFLQLLVIRSEYAYALERLEKLEKQCWENNFFELLPQITRLLLISYDAIDPYNFERRNQLTDGFEKANKLSYLVNQLYVYDKRMHTNKKDYALYVNKIQKLIRDAKVYPRIQLIYHYIAFSRGINANKMSNALTRHLNVLHKLRAANPNIPMFKFRPYYQAHLDEALAHYEQIYWFLKNKFLKAYYVIVRREEILKQNPFLQTEKTSNSYFNDMIVAMAANKVEAGLSYVSKYEEFVKHNNVVEGDSPVCELSLFVYTYAFPKIKHPNPQELLDEVAAHDENFKVQDDLSYGGILSWKWQLLVAYGYWEEAMELAKNEKLILYLGQHKKYLDMEPFTHELIAMLKAKDIEKLKATQKLNKQKTKVNKLIAPPDVIFHHRWLDNTLTYYLKKFKSET